MRFVTSTQRHRISDFFEHVRKTAEQAFENDGCCVPVAIFLQDEGKTVLPLHHLVKDKDLASSVIKQAIENLDPLAFVLVSEAWMARQNSKATNTHDDNLGEKYQGQLTQNISGGSEKPKRGVEEVVMLQGCSMTGENFLLTAEIIRDAGSKPTLKPWERLDNRSTEGRFIFDLTPLVERQ